MTEISGLVLLNMKITFINFTNDVLLDTGVTVEIKLIILACTDIYVNTQQLLFNTTLFCAWRHVSSAHTAETCRHVLDDNKIVLNNICCVLT